MLFITVAMIILIASTQTPTQDSLWKVYVKNIMQNDPAKYQQIIEENKENIQQQGYEQTMMKVYIDHRLDVERKARIDREVTIRREWEMYVKEHKGDQRLIKDKTQIPDWFIETYDKYNANW